MQKQFFLRGSGKALQLFSLVALPAPIPCSKRDDSGSNNGLQRGVAGSLLYSLVLRALRLPPSADREERARQVALRARACLRLGSDRLGEFLCFLCHSSPRG